MDFYSIMYCTIFISALQVVVADYCQYDYYYSTLRYRYCDYGCCNNKYSSYSSVCCTQNLAGVIAGAVIGSLVGLAIIIGLIIFCCYTSHNAKRRRGVVIQPTNTAPTQNIVVTNTTVAPGPSTVPGPYGPVTYGYPSTVPPPAYALYNNVPQGGTDPAYPPPAAKY